jgi:threonine aldolase
MPRFDFRSDNQAPVPPELMAALLSNNHDTAPAYGSDDTTARAISALSDCFETPLNAYLLTSGTAANALALAQSCPPYGAVICHEHAHIHCDECGAPEFFGHGLKLLPRGGQHGLLSAEAIDHAMAGFGFKGAHEPLPSVVSISQASEWGAVYTPTQVEAISERARANGLWLHMDGARLANALADSGASPADMTWRAGVDLLSLGFTKNGALAAEVLVVFRQSLAEGLERRIMKAGHLLSKQRYIAAQVLASLEQGRWLQWASNANRCARELADWMESQSDCQVVAPVQANEVFVRLSEARAAQMRQHGFAFHPWPLLADCYRFVASWDGEADILAHALKELEG